MIIDFHTHTFPDELADRAVGTLAHSGGIHNYLDGRVHSLTDSMKKAGIDYSVLLPVAVAGIMTAVLCPLFSELIH